MLEVPVKQGPLYSAAQGAYGIQMAYASSPRATTRVRLANNELTRNETGIGHDDRPCFMRVALLRLDVVSE